MFFVVVVLKRDTQKVTALPIILLKSNKEGDKQRCLNIFLRPAKREVKKEPRCYKNIATIVIVFVISVSSLLSTALTDASLHLYIPNDVINLKIEK